MRGTIQPVRTASLTPKASEVLLADLELPLVSIEDLYGGKLVAAMDRQHPRDLFDVMQLFQHEGITAPIRRAFVVYLASHNRPVHEVLFSAKRDIAQEYAGSFRGMTAEPVTLESLLWARDLLIKELRSGLNAGERHFLLSLARNEPDWNLLDIPHLSELPAIRWKLKNLSLLQKVNPRKFEAQAVALENAFQRGSGESGETVT